VTRIQVHAIDAAAASQLRERNDAGAGTAIQRPGRGHRARPGRGVRVLSVRGQPGL